MITLEQLAKARDLISTGIPKAVGYRLMIKPIEAITGMEISEKEKYSELGKLGFETKTNEQKERESKGGHHGILISKGDHAFRAESLGNEDWVKEGDVLIYDRYAGVEIELPPGSGELYRFTNDESVLGVMEANHGGE
jgi:co-chaperonin GroES (HSP10)